VPDVHDRATRSRNMSAIKAKDTKPELMIRKILHGAGFRYRLHDKSLPRKPDLVFPKYNAVIFVHGCFWHKHQCHLFKWPGSRKEFWQAKINRNAEKDAESIKALQKSGWRTMTVWECCLKGKQKMEAEKLAKTIGAWLRSSSAELTLAGKEAA
jgi:DNA mismatch endonuclease (patch repair protein)